MKFVKLSDSKLKIFVANHELPESNNLNDFMIDSSKAKSVFLDMLEEAFDETGFNTKDYKIRIQAKELTNGNYIFLISKLMKIADIRPVVRPKRVTKKDSVCIYQFKSFDDIYDFSNFLKSNSFKKNINFSKLAVSCALYKYEDVYYLCCNNINDNFKGISLFYTGITEFSKLYSKEPLFMSTLSEYGNVIIQNDALTNIMKL